MQNGDSPGLLHLNCVSHGVIMRPVPSSIENGVHSSDPELEKLWQDIDDYCASDEAKSMKKTSNPLATDDRNSQHSLVFAMKEAHGELRSYGGKAVGHQTLEVPSRQKALGHKHGGTKKKYNTPTVTDVSLANRSGKTSATGEKLMSQKNGQLSTLVGKRRLGDTGFGGNKSVPFPGSSKAYRKTPMSDLQSRRIGEMQGSNEKTFSSAEMRPRKISTLYIRDQVASSGETCQRKMSSSSCSSSPNEDGDPNDDRERVKRTLDLFRGLCKELKHEGQIKRIDYRAGIIIKGKRDFVDLGKFIGYVPGVDVGDEFRYRMELALVSLHKPLEAGIDFMRCGRNDICISIVATASVDYANDMQNPEILIYCGQGGNVGRAKTEPEDQRLEKGNLALKNSIATQNPVRVVRGKKEAGKAPSVYIYDGLYTVKTFWPETAAHGKLVFKFELRRIPGQPQLGREQWRKLGGFRQSSV